MSYVNIKMNLKEIECEEVALVKTVMKLQVP